MDLWTRPGQAGTGPKSKSANVEGPTHPGGEKASQAPDKSEQLGAPREVGVADGPKNRKLLGVQRTTRGGRESKVNPGVKYQSLRNPYKTPRGGGVLARTQGGRV